jgi:hypothetical protein
MMMDARARAGLDFEQAAKKEGTGAYRPEPTSPTNKNLAESSPNYAAQVGGCGTNC